MSTEEVKRHFIDYLEGEHIDFELICTLGGDNGFDKLRQEQFEKIKKERGDAIFSDMMYLLTHKQYKPEEAKHIWKKVLEHKWNISKILKRNVGIIVAILDYLYNIDGSMESPLLISNQDKRYVAEIALKDGLTGIYDHFTFMHILYKEVVRHKRYGDELCLAIADLDDFKKVNDNFGHLEGDRYLKKFVSIMKEEARQTDVLGRCGGEEFGILLIRTNQEDAKEMTERIRKKVSEIDSIPFHNQTVSMGISCFPSMCENAKSLFKKADDALFLAKNSGKNQVRIWTSENTKETKATHNSWFARFIKCIKNI